MRKAIELHKVKLLLANQLWRNLHWTWMERTLTSILLNKATAKTSLPVPRPTNKRRILLKNSVRRSGRKRTKRGKNSSKCQLPIHTLNQLRNKMLIDIRVTKMASKKTTSLILTSLPYVRWLTTPFLMSKIQVKMKACLTTRSAATILSTSVKYYSTDM